jgi:hypothetical protein
LQELVNSPFLKEVGTPDQYRAALARAITRGWLLLHESANSGIATKPSAQARLSAP